MANGIECENSGKDVDIKHLLVYAVSLRSMIFILIIDQPHGQKDISGCEAKEK